MRLLAGLQTLLGLAWTLTQHLRYRTQLEDSLQFWKGIGRFKEMHDKRREFWDMDLMNQDSHELRQLQTVDRQMAWKGFGMLEGGPPKGPRLRVNPKPQLQPQSFGPP